MFWFNRKNAKKKLDVYENLVQIGKTVFGRQFQSDAGRNDESSWFLPVPSHIKHFCYLNWFWAAHTILKESPIIKEWVFLEFLKIYVIWTDDTNHKTIFLIFSVFLFLEIDSDSSEKNED
jgi:hypothetical protein